MSSLLSELDQQYASLSLEDQNKFMQNLLSYFSAYYCLDHARLSQAWMHLNNTCMKCNKLLECSCKRR